MTESEAKKIIDEWKCTHFPVNCVPKEKPLKMVGKWISTECNEEWYSTMYICSYCQGEMIGASNYCPDCGRRMLDEDNKQS